jgi:hypothetical protein
VQFTETDYNFSEGFEYEGKINIRWNNRSVNFLDVEKTITNVTIKDGVNIANNLTSNGPKSVLLGKVGAQFMIWRYLEPFSICVPLIYPLRTDPGITSPYFIICVAI